MVITYQGENYFRIQSGSFTVLIDPINSRSFKGANIILNTLKPPLVEHGEEEKEEYLWIENGGEYETDGMRIYGWGADNENKKTVTAYLFELEDIRVGVLGHLHHEPTPELISKLEEIDILILPGGGSPYISEANAAKLVREIEPGIVIPSLFTKEPKKFFAELSQSPKEEEKLVVKKKDIKEEGMVIAYLANPKP
ncbi:hypothetical protein A3A21_04075 [Candidatus Jorgensenbacteria bacterium RIFCSPLOWO2_01_FULL_45_25b]|uniref:Zn-dependent hydrolase n=1 Tax=Candidatus Jorgensenbacteria bacterium RIFCSPLOWO2_01_FULL_45_25b TaxID=1798471 RepID=A0A1F6BWJ8_9BACT|nr:MAG: hypothetical protein A3A21_04075 [Candidatus Jorgensenbacteria bacterium RIFCSPLOWO2_01_FULL_45_25b]